MSATIDRTALERQADRLAASTGNFDMVARARELARALVIYRELGDERSVATVLTRLGNIASNLADYAGAIDYLHEAEQIATALGDAELERNARGHLAFVHSELGDHETALAMAMRGWERDSRASDPEVRLLAVNSVGVLLSLVGRHEEGIAKIRQADDIIDGFATGTRREHLRSQSKADLSDALLRAGNARPALEAAEQGAAFAEGIGHAPLIMLNRLYAGRAALALDDAPLAAERLGAAAELAATMGLKSQESQARLLLAEALRSLARHVEALDSYRTGHRLERDLRRDEGARRLEFRRARAEIDVALREKQDAERMLFAVLPRPIATRMKGGESRIADEIDDASILFADLVGFTGLAARTPARELIGVLDRIFSAFDQLTESFGLEKVKTIGDAYMAVGGALDSSPDHLERCARLAVGMLAAVETLGEGIRPKLAIRIGLHVGPAIAGVIGTHRLSYDLWGETVNLASRLESSGAAGRVHVSVQVAERLRGTFALEPRGPCNLKGVGDVPTFFLA